MSIAEVEAFVDICRRTQVFSFRVKFAKELFFLQTFYVLGLRVPCVTLFLSGQDLFPGREGGTWLGVSKAGKIGVLLNILGILDTTRQGRGRTVKLTFQIPEII